MIVNTVMNLLSNPISFIIIIFGLVMFCFWWFRAYIKPTTMVDLLRPRDRRGKSLRVSLETDLGLICRKTGGVIHRFIKAGPSWTFHDKGRMITRFFAIEGKAYTAIPKPPENLSSNNEDDEEVIMVNVNVKDFLKHIWGEPFYNAIPDTQKDAVESDVVGITIEAKGIDENKWELDHLSSDDINDENDSRVLNLLAGAQEPSLRKNLMTQFIGIVVGALLMYMLITKGIF